MVGKENEVVYDVYAVCFNGDKKDISYLFSNVTLDFLLTERFKRELDALRNNFNYERVEYVLCQVNLKK